MKIENYTNTVICRGLLVALLEEYNYYALPHLNIKKKAKWNETNVRTLMSFVAKCEDLDDAILYIRNNTFTEDKGVESFTSLLGKYTVNGIKTYHGVNVSRIIGEDFDDNMFNLYEQDNELEEYVSLAFAQDGIAYRTNSVEVVPFAKPTSTEEETCPVESFAEGDDEENTQTENTESSDVPTASPVQMDEIKEQLQKVAEETLSGYQLVLQENAMEMLNQALENKKNEIVKEVTTVMLNHQVTPVVINLDAENYQLPEEHYHEEFANVLKLVQNHVDIYLYSEAGIGKSHLVNQVAKALKLDLYIMLPGDAISLLGYEDAYGKFHDTAFTRWAKNGGILYGSEFDANDASLILNLNTALANGYTVINGETVTLHEDCRFIADGNSKLTGATASYSGRQRQDSSIIDRLAFVEMKNDYKLELALAENNKEWITFIKAFREQKKAQGSNMIVSLRATQMVLKLEKFLGTKSALEKGLLKGTNIQVTQAIADKVAIQLPNNKYAKVLVECTRGE